MKKALIFLAEGFEEVEALSVLDALKRGGVEVTTASVGEDKAVKSSHGVTIVADVKVSEVKDRAFDLVFLPGGMPGSINLAQSWDVNEIVIRHSQSALVAAICAAPAVVLGPAGLLEGKKATCYPGCDEYYPGFEFSSEGVVEDGRIITAKSAAYGWKLGFVLVRRLMGEEAADKVRSSIYWEF